MADVPQTIGAYRILGVLGRGGMGVVYRAQHQEDGRLAALKTVHAPSQWALSSLRREIHALARIHHPQVVRILDEGVEGGLPWYAMELLEGITLRRFADRLFAKTDTQPLPEPNVVERSASDLGSVHWWTESLVHDDGMLDQATLSAQSWTSPRLRPALAPAEVGSNARSTTFDQADLIPERDRQMPSTSLAAGGRLAEVLTLMRRLCAPLAFLHGEGIVHRDLKLENVLIRAASGERLAANSGKSASSSRGAPGSLLDASSSQLTASSSPVLVDFGLISLFGGALSRDALELRGGASGTVFTMAPEQIVGDLVDARADLYALGCVLYELLTGRPPFIGATPAAVIYGHLKESPLPPSRLMSGVPPALDALVLRLLAKEPKERFGHADDVGASLGSLGAEDGCAEMNPKSRPYLYRPSFVGRDEPLEDLRRELRSLESGLGTIMLLGGESGVGKTRLALELARNAERARVSVLAGESILGGSPLHPLRPMLQSVADRCRELGPDEIERLLGQRGRVLSLYEPALIGLPGQEIDPEATELPPEAARLRLFVFLTETAEAFTTESPLLLVLDDLQWADELTLGWLEFLARSGRIDRTRLMVLGTYRTEEAAGILRSLLENPRMKRMELKRLEVQAVGSMVGDMLAVSPPPQAFSRFLARQSEGNPFFVAEYLRTAVVEGVIDRDEAGHWQVQMPDGAAANETMYDALPLPGSIRDLVGRRLGALTPATRRIAEIAAVLGRAVDARLLEDLGAVFDVPVLEAIGELLARQFLEEGEAGGLRFVHDKLREVTYEQTETSLRKGLHAGAAEAIEIRFNDQRDEHLAILGLHWERAGAVDRAQECYLGAGRRALTRFAQQEAEHLFRAYLALVDRPNDQSIEVRNEQGNVLRILGRVPEAILEHSLALRESLELRNRLVEGRTRAKLALAYHFAGQNDLALKQSLGAIAVAEELGDLDTRAYALWNLCAIHHSQGRVDDARTALEQGLALQRELGNRRMEGIFLGTLALFHQEQSRREEAARVYDEALSIHRETGDRSYEGMALGNLAVLRFEEGDVERARALFEQALVLLRDTGDRRNEAIHLGNLGELILLQKNPGFREEAMRLLEQSLALHREIGNRHHEVHVLNSMAQVRMEEGNAEVARLLLSQSLALAHEIGNRRGEGFALCLAARIERRVGDVNEAARMIQRAVELFTSVGDTISHALCLCQLGHVELALDCPAAELLEQVQEVVIRLKVDPRSELGNDVARLRRAVEAVAAGRPTARGECVEDFPAAWISLQAP